MTGKATSAASAICRVVTEAKPRSANMCDATARMRARVSADFSARVGRKRFRREPGAAGHSSSDKSRSPDSERCWVYR
jgi:hypothetical protein